MKGSKKRSAPEASKSSDGEDSIADSDEVRSNADDDTIPVTQQSLVLASQSTLSQQSHSQPRSGPGADDEEGKGGGVSPVGCGEKRGSAEGGEGPQAKRAKIEVSNSTLHFQNRSLSVTLISFFKIVRHFRAVLR